MNEIVQDGNNLPTEDTEISMLGVIQKAALDPNVDIDKMERLLAMKERLDSKQYEMSFNTSMALCQAEMGRISADAVNPQTRSKYASYGQIDKHLRPIYTANWFSLSFDTDDSKKDHFIRIICHISHVNGFSRTHHIDMPTDGKGAKGNAVMTQTHAAGAAVQYGMRYLLKMIFNVAIGEDDNDGNTPVKVITEEQVTIIYSAIKDNDINMQRFMAWLKRAAKCDSIESMPTTSFVAVTNQIKQLVGKKDEG